MSKGAQRFKDAAGLAIRKVVLWASGAQSTVQNSPYLTGDATSAYLSWQASDAALDTAKLGGLLSAQVAASAAVTNTTDETPFDQSYTIPANVLAAGSVLRIKGWGTATATNSTDTLTIAVKLGATALLTTAAVDVADDDVWFFDITVQVRTAGASGTLVAWASYQDPDAAGTAPKWVELNSTAVDTTGALAVTSTATWSVASASNSCRSEGLIVELVR